MTAGVLVSGSGSGLGRYLCRELGAQGLVRGTPLVGLQAETVVHCAANARRDASEEELRTDNVGYTEALLAVPAERFVLMSTIEAAAPSSGYARAKAEAEALVIRSGRRPLVLRCGALLGPGMRPNSLTRVLASEPVSLSGDSVFLWVLYADVLGFLRAALERGLEGTYNLVPSAPASLAEAAEALGLTPRFGGFHYSSPEADAGAAADVWEGFRHTALENALIFARGRSS